MTNKFTVLKTIISKYKKYIFLILLLLSMLLIHQYIFLYADDLYYCRDASGPLSSLPKLALKELNVNGRVWVHVLLMGLLKNNIYIFRIINPVVIVLTALLIVKISINSNKTNKNFLIATFFTFIFFLFLNSRISHTTIYYAACALNYLYPMTVALLLAYRLYSEYSISREKYKIKWDIIILAFFAGSSTQQAGMISIGFIVLISIYFSVFEKKKIVTSIIPYYCSIFIGYALVTYGSVKRMIFEMNSGKSMNIMASAVELIKTNIFSIPVFSYVLIVCLCCLFWLYNYSYKNNEDTNKMISIFNKLLACILSVGIITYVYIIAYRINDLKIFSLKDVITKVEIGFIAFTLVYLISILYISTLILIKERYPLPLFCCINAIGAQIMLLVVDSRFASTYKIIFPSLLLMSIFIVYSFVKFYDNNIFLSLIMMAFALSFGKVSIAIIALIFVVLSVVCKMFLTDMKVMKMSILGTCIILGLAFFSTTYRGYKEAAIVQNHNLKAIKEYHRSSDKSVLILKKTPDTEYGYNVHNWNTMPYFMRQCYKINKGTVIKYIK